MDLLHVNMHTPNRIAYVYRNPGFIDPNQLHNNKIELEALTKRPERTPPKKPGKNPERTLYSPPERTPLREPPGTVTKGPSGPLR